MKTNSPVRRRPIAVMSLAAALCAFAAGSASAAVDWADWTSKNDAKTQVSGVAGGVMIDVLGPFSFAQVSGGTNYWAPSTPYTSATVSNAPATPDIIAITGGGLSLYTVNFSQPVTNPLMAIVSLGQGGVPATYDFADAPFDVLSHGAGYWGGGTLTEMPGDVLSGREGHGTIQFQGTFSSISWTVPTAEYWHGFTVGIIPAPGTAAALAVPALFFARRRRA